MYSQLGSAENLQEAFRPQNNYLNYLKKNLGIKQIKRNFINF